jgi:hypothetical protein
MNLMKDHIQDLTKVCCVKSIILLHKKLRKLIEIKYIFTRDEN